MVVAKANMRLVVAGVLITMAAGLPEAAGFIVSGFSSGANVAINTMMVTTDSYAFYLADSS